MLIERPYALDYYGHNEFQQQFVTIGFVKVFARRRFTSSSNCYILKMGQAAKTRGAGFKENSQFNRIAKQTCRSR